MRCRQVDSTLLQMDNSAFYMIPGAIAFILGAVLLYYYYRAKGLANEMWAVDTYQAAELRRMCSGGFNAVVEVQGNATCDQPITSPAAHVECAWCRTKIYLERKGSKGSTYWSLQSDKTLYTLFKVHDETGYVLVDPVNSDIDTNEPYEIITEGRPWFENILSSDTGRYKITEEFFIPTGYVYVLGQATSTGGGTSPDVLVHYPTEGYTNAKHPFFVISRKTEKRLADEEGISLKISLWSSMTAFLCAAYCGLILLGIIPCPF